MAMNESAKSTTFHFSEGRGETTMLLESDRIDECMEFYRENHLTSISICRTHCGLLDLGFLKEHSYVSRLSIQNGDEIDVSALRYASGLKELYITNNTQELNLCQFPCLTQFSGTWHPGLRISSSCTSLRSFGIWKYKPQSRDLTDLPKLPHLESLWFVQGNLTSLRGIGRFPNLKYFSAALLPKLESIAAIEELKDGRLEMLDFDTCKRMQDHAAVECLKSLRILRLSKCGEVPNIKFLRTLPNLRHFSFVDTNVLDGNLEPLLWRLDWAGFFNKRHYSHTDKEIDAILTPRAHEKYLRAATEGPAKFPATEEDAAFVRDLFAARLGWQHLRVRRDGNRLTVESGAEKASKPRARFARVAEYDMWMTELPDKNGTFHFTGYRAALVDILGNLTFHIPAETPEGAPMQVGKRDPEPPGTRTTFWASESDASCVRWFLAARPGWQHLRARHERDRLIVESGSRKSPRARARLTRVSNDRWITEIPDENGTFQVIGDPAALVDLLDNLTVNIPPETPDLASIQARKT